MKTLTVRQPWANLIASGRKTIETRTWSTNYRDCRGRRRHYYRWACSAVGDGNGTGYVSRSLETFMGQVEVAQSGSGSTMATSCGDCR